MTTVLIWLFGFVVGFALGAWITALIVDAASRPDAGLESRQNGRPSSPCCHAATS
jgi:hypothetical protein